MVEEHILCIRINGQIIYIKDGKILLKNASNIQNDKLAKSIKTTYNNKF